MILFINPQILIQVLKIDKQRLEWRTLLKVNQKFPAKLDKNFFQTLQGKDILFYLRGDYTSVP